LAKAFFDWTRPEKGQDYCFIAFLDGEPIPTSPENALGLCLSAFSDGEPVSTSPENAFG
jgi:hypothetical protein